ncbi:hypothetical protein OG455_28700 [Kitasatospora sp. NBC_01287]|uniref:hypothetical protein n=1 Tax=Kitasatospora sp. NBC_01287 TaxID=2903573 RepID=UPI00224D753E|nr:hypothetical protein [Kitasatospora sp. NBC_01287]MCX4749443.1 hypothetical protein [Kitasatospora sp. NBC_01287]
MDVTRVGALREVLSGSPLLDATRSFAGSLRRAVTRRSAHGLLLVGSAGYEPWHLAAHLDDEAAWAQVPGLAPVLIRHQAPASGTPAQLRHDLRRLTEAGRGETVLVVTPQAAGDALLERVHDARRGGATVLALAAGDPELAGLAHESLTVESPEEPGFDLVQHLVSAAAGEPPRSRLAALGGLSRLARQFTTEPVNRW